VRILSLAAMVKLTQKQQFRLLDQLSQRAAEARARGESAAEAGLSGHERPRGPPTPAARVYTQPTERKAEFADAAGAQAAADRGCVSVSELRLADGDCCCAAMRLLRRTHELLQERIRINALMQGERADECCCEKLSEMLSPESNPAADRLRAAFLSALLSSTADALHAANPQLVSAVGVAQWSRVLGCSDRRLWSAKKTEESSGE